MTCVLLCHAKMLPLASRPALNWKLPPGDNSPAASSSSRLNTVFTGTLNCMAIFVASMTFQLKGRRHRIRFLSSRWCYCAFIQPGNRGHPAHGQRVLGAGPDISATVLNVHCAVHRLHRGMGQIGDAIAGLDYFTGLRQT